MSSQGQANRIPIGSSQISQSGANFQKGAYYAYNYSGAFILVDQGSVLYIDANIGGAWATRDIVLAAGVSQGYTTPERAGGRVIDLSGVPRVLKNLSLVRRFKALLECSENSTGAWWAQAELFDLTTGLSVATVDNSAASDKSIATEASTTLGVSALTNGHIYVVRTSIGGSPSHTYDRAILSGARIELSYE